jgi:anti-sigma B factor antagonist
MAGRESFQLGREDITAGVSVLDVVGDADRFRVEEVAEAIEAVRRDDRDVVVDISAAAFLDSAMIAAFVAAAEQGRRRGGALVIACTNPRLRRSLELKGLETILRIAETREGALDLLADNADSG